MYRTKLHTWQAGKETLFTIYPGTWYIYLAAFREPSFQKQRVSLNGIPLVVLYSAKDGCYRSEELL